MFSAAVALLARLAHEGPLPRVPSFVPRDVRPVTAGVGAVSTRVLSGWPLSVLVVLKTVKRREPLATGLTDEVRRF